MRSPLKTDQETNEEIRARLLKDPRVVVHRRKTTEPYVPTIWFEGPLDINWLIGRRDDDEVPPRLRGIDD